MGIFLQDFSQITANMARIALPFILTPVLEHFCQKSCSPILSLEMINCSLNPGVSASKFSSGGCLPKSMLIKINIDISSEFILEIQTISAKTDKNTLRPNQISGTGKFCPYSKEQKPRFRKAENQGKQGMGKELHTLCNTCLIKGVEVLIQRLNHNQKPHKWVHK